MKSAVAALLIVATILCSQSASATPVPAQPYLLFSTWLSVSRMNTDGSNYVELADADAQAVDYHLSENKLFWNDATEGKIYMANLDDGSNATVIVSDINKPRGLAVDWINNKLYFSYSSPNSALDYPNHLAYYDLTTGETVEITAAVMMAEQLFRPRSRWVLFYDLAVDPEQGKLYWTTGFLVMESSLSATDVKQLYRSVCSLRYIGLSANTLYFTDEYCYSEGVRSLDLATGTTKNIVSGKDYYHDVAAYDNMVYWTGFGRVRSAPISGGGPVTDLVKDFQYGLTFFRGITVVHPDLH